MVVSFIYYAIATYCHSFDGDSGCKISKPNCFKRKSNSIVGAVEGIEPYVNPNPPMFDKNGNLIMDVKPVKLGYVKCTLVNKND